MPDTPKWKSEYNPPTAREHAPGEECLRQHPELYAAAMTLRAADYADAQRKARLWNAAPALLSACQGVRWLIDDWLANNDASSPEGEDCEALVAAIAAAAPDGAA